MARLHYASPGAPDAVVLDTGRHASRAATDLVRNEGVELVRNEGVELVRNEVAELVVR